MFCQLAHLRHCLRGRIRRALDDLPDTLDETYARTLEGIGGQNWECAHRLFQCVAVASRPLRVEELAEFLAFDFEEGSTPSFLTEWRPEDPAHAVLSTCTSLLAVVTVDEFPVIQFAHFSVKEYLTSGRLAEAKDTVSRFHVSMTPAHTIVAQACLGVLLHLDENITEDSLEEFPLAKYAAEHWVKHAQIESVSSKLQDGMKQLFDPGKNHLSVWGWIHDPDDGSNDLRSESPAKDSAMPLHYAAFWGIHDMATFLIVEHSKDVNARGFYRDETPLLVTVRRGNVQVARVLLENGADREARDRYDWSPLERASGGGNLELIQVLLEHGADPNARDARGRSLLYLSSDWGRPAVVLTLLKHGADVKARDNEEDTPLHRAKVEQVAQLLLEHGADANALDSKDQTPLFLSLKYGVGIVRVLLEHGSDANARDAINVTPLHRASESDLQEEEQLDIVRLLLQYGSDIHALDDRGRTPFMRATEGENGPIMQLLLENGAEDHRK